ncbi:amino acid adenylation domain-containing protein [Gelidibacter algens]|uniref:Amino acid adenylation domain-containing protein n=1 Tax=Gelidibacter algens TaxID=49280 RepID=A0A1A7R6X0_9FLAO|nr:non-ribosomal peptide synthetase [Gelidibacter algens]OBX27248.1 hypothetical protein A9996_00555 [Gelidibacter algens]RAJ22114.1 amino acid adenylation domain-containing protein [Gelidibacter algens]
MKLKLTASQMSLWVGQKMNPDVPLYNTAYSYEISGAIDKQIFEKAFQLLIDTTDALRIRFYEEDGIPYQEAKDKLDYNIEVIDFSSDPEFNMISDWLLNRSLKKLDLSQQVFDTVLIKKSENTYIWFMNMHHLITDGVSRKIIFDRMNKYYEALSGHHDGIQPVDSASYLDYVKSELDAASSKTHEDSYWSSKVRDIEKIHSFYGIHPKPDATEASRVFLHLGRERSQKLQLFLQRPEVKGWTAQLALFNVMSTLLFIFMYRVSGQKKLSIGAPLHNRISRKFHHTVGYFLEIFPMLTEIDDADSFKTLLQRVKLENSDNLKHALQDTVTSEISNSFNVVLNYIHTGFSNFNGFKTTSEWIYTGHIDSNHQMRCHVMVPETNGEYKIMLDLNHGTFDHELQQKVPNHLLSLLDAMLQDIEMDISVPSLVTPKEQKLLIDPDFKIVEPTTTALTYFEENALKRPNSVALQGDKQTLTYSELNKKANQLAHYLYEKKILENQKVALHFYRNPEYIIAVLAVLKLGATFIPIPSDQPSERIRFIIGNSDASLVLTESGLIKNLDIDSNRLCDITKERSEISKQPFTAIQSDLKKNDMAYILYTSGSTGKPKGVRISHSALSNYLGWAKAAYNINEKSIFPLFSSIGFDLTITSTLLPLISGGRIITYKENTFGADMSLMQVFEDNMVNTIKLTPSHLALVQEKKISSSYIHTMIIGGEDLKIALAKSMQSAFPNPLRIFNEYGPTEATIGCIVSEFDSQKHLGTSVPIGTPIANMQAYVLDSHNNIVPQGVVGELYLSGIGLAEGYVDAPEMTEAKFVANPFFKDSKMYRSGDLCRINGNGEFEYLGRTDDQVKLRGYRIELSDIESNLVNYPEIDLCAVVLIEDKTSIPEEDVVNCIECGLPSNYPNTDFNENGVCHLCTAFESYKVKAERYFKNDDELLQVLTSKRNQNPNYDCISLLSGGKDSTYVLARLVNMGLRVLAFTMDNGYISDQAKANIDTIIKKLGVDHVYGETPHMNDIFVDSLHRHHNVCNGCFKTIYTLSTQIALEKEIPFIVTGLSRGQFFETRLTEELFWDEALDTKKIDQTILEARKLYHQEDDAVKKLLDVSMFDDDKLYEKVEFVDFYRFSDVSLEELLVYLKENVGWVRPTDTGRSTNCLINQVGIYVHKKEMGYSNYSFPYSWDVRLGHKTRDESLEEINEVIDETEVKRIMKEIGYDKSDDDWQNSDKLVAYYTGNPNLSLKDIREFAEQRLPSYMVPTVFKHLNEIPLTKNGKVDKKALKNLTSVQLELDTPYAAPRNEIEEILERIWQEVLQLKKVGIYDNFIALGGHSLAAIRATARINDEIELNFPLNKIFELPTIAEYSAYIEQTLMALLEE